MGVTVAAGGGLVRVTAAETGGMAAEAAAEAVGAAPLQATRPDASARSIVQITVGTPAADFFII